MQGSIEERVLGVQAEKRKLMMTAFRENEGKRGKKTTNRLGDIKNCWARQRHVNIPFLACLQASAITS